MGRSKLPLELMKSESSRKATFKKRKSGLVKKAHELSTLCGVDVCFILYPPEFLGHSPEPTVWPYHCKVQEMIKRYRTQPTEDCKKRTNNLSNFFECRRRKVCNELVKLRKKNTKAKYPSWDVRFNGLSEDEMRQIANLLANKIEEVQAKLGLMHGYTTVAASGTRNGSLVQQTLNHPRVVQSLYRSSSVQLEVLEHLQQISLVNPCELGAQIPGTYDGGLNLDPNPMVNSTIRMLMDNYQCNQFGGLSGTSNAFHGPLDGQFCYDQVLDNVILNNPGGSSLTYYSPVMQQYGPAIQPVHQYGQAMQPVQQYLPAMQPVQQYGQAMQQVQEHCPAVLPAQQNMDYPIMASNSSQFLASQMEEYFQFIDFTGKQI